MRRESLNRTRNIPSVTSISAAASSLPASRFATRAQNNQERPTPPPPFHESHFGRGPAPSSKDQHVESRRSFFPILEFFPRDRAKTHPITGLQTDWGVSPDIKQRERGSSDNVPATWRMDRIDSCLGPTDRHRTGGKPSTVGSRGAVWIIPEAAHSKMESRV